MSIVTTEVGYKRVRFQKHSLFLLQMSLTEEILVPLLWIPRSAKSPVGTNSGLPLHGTNPQKLGERMLVFSDLCLKLLLPYRDIKKKT